MSLFGKKNNVVLDQQVISTLISAGCILDGDLKAPDYVRIDGQVKGLVTIAEGLILGESGLITGNVTTKEMIVYGTVNGNISVQSLEIRNTGKINGEIKTVNLKVESGAVYNGNLNMAEK